MEYPDLYVFPKDHPPSPYGEPVSIIKIGKDTTRFGEGRLPSGLLLSSIGWLEKPCFASDRVPGECVEALFDAHGIAIIRDGTRGKHSCTLCGQGPAPPAEWRGRTIDLKGHGHYLVQMGDTVFMAPELILHYILEHRYCPPPEFVHATIRGRFLVEDELDIKWES